MPVAATRPTQLAAQMLAGLGACTRTGRSAPGELIARRSGGAVIRAAVRGEVCEASALAPGATDYAVALCLVTAVATSLLSQAEHEVDPDAVIEQLVVAPPPGSVARPVEVGDGWLWCDLVAGEHEVFESLVDGQSVAQWNAHELAATAQSVGLASVDFRPRSAWPDRSVAQIRQLETSQCVPSLPVLVGDAQLPLVGMRVCDLTSMWSGPLATRLLAGLGAQVSKVEPGCRLDGTRDIPEVFEALNRGKQRLDLDLRDAEQHAAFLAEVLRSDLVISNFTPRVATNLAIEPDDLVRGRDRPLVCLQMPAFPAGTAERHWRAYGKGIHAVSGLGLTATREPWMTQAPYCDSLSGFAATAIAVVLRLASASGRSWAAEVPMLNVACQVARLAPPLAAPPPASASLPRAGRARSLFHGPNLPAPETAAPTLELAGRPA